MSVYGYGPQDLLKRMDILNGAKWTHFNVKGAIVSYANFKFGSQHSRARYRDGWKADASAHVTFIGGSDISFRER